MDKNELIRTIREMIAASSCCAELKAAGEKGLAAVGTAAEHDAGAALLAEARVKSGYATGTPPDSSDRAESGARAHHSARS